MELVALLVGAILGLIPATIASRKGRSFGLWWVYGALLFLIALIHALWIPSEVNTYEPVRERTCPACGARLDVGASFCRSCGEKVVGGPVYKEHQ